jgi:hypothetical protein
MSPHEMKAQEQFEAEIRNRVAEELARIQAEAVRRLKVAHVPEQQAQMAMEKVIAVTLRALHLLAETAGASEVELAKAGISPDDQEWFPEYTNGLLRDIQKATAEIVATTIQNVKEGLLQEPSRAGRPGQGVLIRESPPPAGSVSFCEWAMLLVWALGFLASSAFFWAMTGESVGWTCFFLAAVVGAWFVVGSSRWGLLLPLTPVAIVVYAVVFG